MRRFCAFLCCAAYLAFGFVVGAAHVHESGDHHAEMRGLHLDHSHLGEHGGHAHHGEHAAHSHHAHAHAGDQQRFHARHTPHHEGDAVYLTVPAQRSLDSTQVIPAMVSLGFTVEAPAFAFTRGIEQPDAVRGPPPEGPTPARAPPA
jgi:hypothetical protein